jgi:predicted AlkP superfamily phosphohydrolase/phosphomutase
VKRILLPSLLVCLGALAACGPRRPPQKFQQKLVILGFDGMDPRLVQKWMDEGKLPNMKRLAARGSGVRTLGTTHSPESPTAWASFATGVNAGKHNIYDFLIRDTSSYLPDLGMVHFEPPRFILNYIPVSKPVVQSIRGGTSFWVTAGKAGVRSSMLTVPVTFPPEDVPNGELLSGLPLPDIRRTMGTFYYFGTDLSRYEEGNTEFGGILKRLVFDGDTAQTELVGPPNPIVKQQLRELRVRSPLSAPTDADRMRIAELEAREDIRLPVTIHWNKAAKTATVNIGDRSILLGEHQWSKWINLDFDINLLIRVHGMAQMYLIGAGPELQLYISPVNWRPDSPPAAMSSPASLSADLYERLGPYRTLGWAEATWPLNEDRIDEGVFMDDLYRAFDDRAQVILQRIDSKQWDLLVGVIESTDRVQHMMWRLIDPTHPMYDAALAARYGNAIENVYKRADDLVGRLRAKLPPDVVFIVMSDHGFHSFRRGVNLNTWLVQNGYMAFQGQESGKKTLADLFGRGRFFEGVDWSRTKAYAVGLGQIYFNLKGREGQGIVSPGAEYTQLQNEIRSKLLGLADPKTGQPVFRDIYKRDDIYKGEYLQNAPDLEVGFNDGYRVGWQDTLGGISRDVIEDNDRKWSGDHCATAAEISGGILFMNRRIASDHPSIMDLAPTILKYLGVPLPADYDGKPLS